MPLALRGALSSAGEHRLDMAGVAGSIPAAPTILSLVLRTRIMGPSQPIMIPGSLADQSLLVLSEHDIERRKAFVGLEAADIERIRSVRELVERNVDGYVETFFRSLQTLPEAAPLFATPSILAE